MKKKQKKEKVEARQDKNDEQKTKTENIVKKSNKQKQIEKATKKKHRREKPHEILVFFCFLFDIGFLFYHYLLLCVASIAMIRCIISFLLFLIYFFLIH
jgi:hypothetical protein